jgi:hypothetical protein
MVASRKILGLIASPRPGLCVPVVGADYENNFSKMQPKTIAIASSERRRARINSRAPQPAATGGRGRRWGSINLRG